MTGLRRSSVFLGAVAATLALSSCRVSDIAPPPPGTVFVEMRDNFFQPQTVTIASGRSVRWTNQGSEVHTVTAGPTSFESDFIAPRTWFEVRIEVPGTYEYHCSIHPEMIGTVVVQ